MKKIFVYKKQTKSKPKGAKLLIELGTSSLLTRGFPGTDVEGYRPFPDFDA